MAKQTGDMVFIGTYNSLCFYCMNGKYYVRASNPLSRRRVLTDAAFAGTRRYAQWLAEASPIAAAIYRNVPVEKRQKGLYRTITGKALLLLKAGVAGAEVTALLTHEVAMMVKEASKPATRPQRKKVVYNKKPGIPFPQWPGLHMIAVRKTITGTRLHRRTQLRASVQKKAPLYRGARGGRGFLPCATMYTVKIASRQSMYLSEKDDLIRGEENRSQQNLHLNRYRSDLPVNHYVKQLTQPPQRGKSLLAS